MKVQIIIIFDHHHEVQPNQEAELKSQLETLENKVKRLQLRHGLEEIDQQTFAVALKHLTEQINSITEKLNEQKPTISNLDKVFSQSLKKLGNLSMIWASGG